jgi:CRISPR-associated endonuclease/helicase Cas3
MVFYAHTLVDDTGELMADSHWEPLYSDGCAQLRGEKCLRCEAMDAQHGHLNKVAYLCAKFCGELNPPHARSLSDWGYTAGLWHDIGKFAPEWQEYLRQKADPHVDEVSGLMDHSTAGAQLAVQRGYMGHLMATAIAGHHSGLLDARNEGISCLAQRLTKVVPSTESAPRELLQRCLPGPPTHLPPPVSGFTLAFFQRMMFSCLVDADFLATESFMGSTRHALRPNSDASVFEKARAVLKRKTGKFGTPKNPVDKARTVVLNDCLKAASLPQGIFSLTVPTGGGKTLSSLAFALEHAVKHGHSRIIYVVPFTSIIEQNARVFADVLAELGSNIVLEHHSNLSPEKETASSRLATENWDAPIVVTTAVQFYESLFASKTSRSRKLHNIANAVVILDEAQALPVHYLSPCLRALEELTRNYRTTAVLCTATQPAIRKTAQFSVGLEGITEIIQDTTALYASLERVYVQYRQTLRDETIACELQAARQALCIVNTRKHAQMLYQMLCKSDENYHLSALMCPEHRLQVLASVNQRLNEGLPTRLVSTQLIEAGVDIDFPIVYRSMAGLDSIAQAAGRCNRNGLRAMGSVQVFHSEHTAAEAYVRATANVGHEILDLYAEDPLSMGAVNAYFDKYYWQEKDKWDSKEIMADFQAVGDPKLPLLFQYRTAAEKFKLIDDNQISVIIPWDEKAKKLCKQLRNLSVPLHRELCRGLQRYTVQIREKQFRQNLQQFESVRDGAFYVLICPETHYSDTFGLNLNEDAHNTNTLIL